MLDSQKRDFMDLMKASMSLYQQEVSVDALRLWWASLVKFEFKEVQEGFSRYIQDSKNSNFAPRPASIIGIIESINPDGRIGAEEAWAIYPHDEASSAVITDEMAEAMQVAQELLNEGDNVGARMAFKEAYTRITSANKFNGISPKWFASLGHDKTGRDIAIKQAVAKGRISQDCATSLLPAPIPSNIVNAITEVKYLTAKDAAFTDEQKAKARDRVAEIKAMLVSK